MNSKLIRLYGTLKFDVRYELTGAEPRPHPYSRNGAMYVPDVLHIQLASESNDDGKAPCYEDLSAPHATIYGRRIKKDGTAGEQEVKEELYSFNGWPSWAEPLVRDALAQARESAGE